ncbi:hypothetical protein D3C74_409790 [compost metagenome]
MLCSGETVTTQHTLHKLWWILRQNAKMVTFLISDALRQLNLQMSCASLAPFIMKLPILQHGCNMSFIGFNQRSNRSATNKLYRQGAVFTF